MANQKKRTIIIPEPEKQFNAIFFPFISESPETIKPLILHEGGRGSGKSRAIAQRLIQSSLRRKMRIGLVRKVFESIRDSQWKEIRDEVETKGLGEKFIFTKNPLTITNEIGSEFICKGLDKPEKTKSLANVDLIWIEEAEELTKEDWDTLSLVIRGHTAFNQPKQIIMSWNRQIGHWTETEYFNANGTFKDQPFIYHLHSTFIDNKFLDEFYIDRFRRMKRDDPELYKKNALGLPIALRGLIFQNWDVIDTFPENVDEIIYGLDFGVSDPTVLVKVGIKELDIYLDEIIYERGLTNQRLIELLPEKVVDRTAEIYADAEDKNRIDEIYDAHWNIKPADKSKKSVIEGIDFVRGYRLHITRRSTNIRKDFENYKWKTDKNGNAINPEIPMHAYSHGPDGIRYPIWTHLRQVEAAQAGTTKKTKNEMEYEKEVKEKESEDVPIISRSKSTFRYQPKGKRHEYSF